MEDKVIHPTPGQQDDDVIRLEDTSTKPMLEVPPDEKSFIYRFGKTLYDFIIYLYKNGKLNLFLVLPAFFYGAAIISGNMKKWNHFFIISAAIVVCWLVGGINSCYLLRKAKKENKK